MGEGSGQEARGDFIAQASGGSTAIVNVYQSTAAAPVDKETLAEADKRLAGLPLEDVPAPSGVPAGSRMPWRRNALFVGREADLKALASALRAGATAAIGQSTAVTGLGGIGKSQLASEFVYRYGCYFSGGVFWLSFADPGSIPAEIADCGGPRALNLHPDFNNLPLDGQVGLVASAWHSALPRLLVFDNCEDEALLEAWSPRAGGCRVLVTSRRSGWRAELGVSAVPLGILHREESVALLRKHRADLAADDPDLDAIAEELGDLPLALHLAGRFLERYRHAPFGTPGGYLSEVRRPDLLEHRSLTVGGRSPTGHEQDVARTFALSYDRLKPEDGIDRLALALLSRVAWFAPGEPVPRDLLRLSAGLAADDADAAMGFEDGLERLSSLGLVEDQQQGSLVLHRLLADFVRTEAGDAVEARKAVEGALLAGARNINQAGYPGPLVAWQLHLRAVAEQADETKSENAAGLLNSLGYHLNMIADFTGARGAYERALAIDEAAFGPDHPNVAIRVNNLGGVLKALGDLAGARGAYERALAIDEQVLGPEHPNVATLVNNLGSVLQDLGDLAGARGAFERALAIDEAAFGPDHPNVGIDVNNLGLVLNALGDLAGARGAYERALAIDEAAFGPDHPNVGIDVNNLGGVLKALGDLAGARGAYERALAIDEAAFGPDHPNVAIDVNNLGSVLQDLGDLAGARGAYERALAIFEQVLGPEHPNVATLVNNLGGVLKALGDLAGARGAYERALAIDEAAFGPDHPNVAIDVNNLGSVLQDLGDLAGARGAFERALAIFEQVLGPEHPSTRTVRGNLQALK